MKLTLANEKDRARYWGMAQLWSAQQDWAYYRNDKFPAIKGVAEYLANQNGETVFESYVGREYERLRQMVC